LVSKSKKDYSPYITTLTYFGLTINPDGKIQKLANEQEANPGWHALKSGLLDPYLANAKKNNTKLSLLVFSGDETAIEEMISKPVPHAQNLMNDVIPVMKQYGFTDLNLDVESFKENASDEARLHFTEFVKEVKKNLDKQHAGTLTIDASPRNLIKKLLIDLNEVTPLVDHVVLMTYDYHYQGSAVTGAVAPLSGAGTIAEFDTETALLEALKVIPSEKIILGVPLYGYEWETIGESPHSAVIPGTGRVASNVRVETDLEKCATCENNIDELAQEPYITYKDPETATFHQIFYPDEKSTQSKVDFAKKNKLGGVALWALGYEGSTIMDPLKDYKK
jgi:spore germination protein YaaH